MLKSRLFPLFIEVFKEFGINIRAVCERNDVAIREKEGLTQHKGFISCDLLPPAPDSGLVMIEENGIKYEIDVINGQKRAFSLTRNITVVPLQRLLPAKRFSIVSRIRAHSH